MVNVAHLLYLLSGCCQFVQMSLGNSVSVSETVSLTILRYSVVL